MTIIIPKAFLHDACWVKPQRYYKPLPFPSTGRNFLHLYLVCSFGIREHKPTQVAGSSMRHQTPPTDFVAEKMFLAKNAELTT